MNQRLLTYSETCQWLHPFDIPRAPERMTHSVQEALDAAEDFGYPLALKLISQEITHKTDAQMVRLSIENPADLSQAWLELMAKQPNVQVEGVLVQKMLFEAVEVLVGTVFDEQFGHLLVFGAGGILAELLDDSSMLLLPAKAWQISCMVEETRVSRLLNGYRGKAPVDLPALNRLLVNVSRLVEAHASELVSLDMNPVMMLPEGAFVVDTRIYIRN